MVGPGHTEFVPNDDGSISQRRWNDPSWTTRMLDSESLTPSQVAHALRAAYLAGFEDRATFILSALGVRQ